MIVDMQLNVVLSFATHCRIAKNVQALYGSNELGGIYNSYQHTLLLNTRFSADISLSLMEYYHLVVTGECAISMYCYGHPVLCI